MGHEVRFLTPLEFRTLPCPTYPEIRLSLFPQGGVNRTIREFDPDVLHIATEGPLGMAARRFALRHDFPFTTAYHTRFPEYVHARLRLPLSLELRLAAALSRRLERRDGADAGGGRRSRRQWLPECEALVARRGCATSSIRSRASASTARRRSSCMSGRVAVEKNVEAFLELDLPGSKWVVGTGPALERIRERFPQVNYLGLLDREELAKVYAAADVFVFPSKTDTFGLVLLEAMACGLPVAAYPVTGPRDVIGDFEGRRAARRPAHRLPRGAEARSRGCAGPRAAVHLARGHRAILQPSASAQARGGASRRSPDSLGKQSVATPAH